MFSSALFSEMTFAALDFSKNLYARKHMSTETSATVILFDGEVNKSNSRVRPLLDERFAVSENLRYRHALGT